MKIQYSKQTSKLSLGTAGKKVYKKFIECTDVLNGSGVSVAGAADAFNEANADLKVILDADNYGKDDEIDITCPTPYMNYTVKLKYYIWNYDGTIVTKTQDVVFNKLLWENATTTNTFEASSNGVHNFYAAGFDAFDFINSVKGTNNTLWKDEAASVQLTLNTPADVTAELKKAGVDVDASGNFTAPDTFTVTLNAKSGVNGKTASLPVVVTVPNGKSTVVPSVAKTVMHNAYYYDKDAKRVGTDKLTRYNSVTVSPKTTTINGKAYYEVVENGKLSGKFINADNIDGTKRTLKHNAYVYKSSKKRANKVVLKKGTEVTTYGGSYTFKNGKQYYKIGNNTDKTYVKASNF